MRYLSTFGKEGMHEYFMYLILPQVLSDQSPHEESSSGQTHMATPVSQSQLQPSTCVKIQHQQTDAHMMMPNPGTLGYSGPRTEPCSVCLRSELDKDAKVTLARAKKSAKRSKMRCKFCNRVLCEAHAMGRCWRR
jgi:hypothetical protein